MHVVTESSNPDIQALIAMNRQLGGALLRLVDEVAALRAEIAAIPDQFVVPNAQGQIVIAGRVVKPGTPLADVQGEFPAPADALVDLRDEDLPEAGTIRLGRRKD